MTRSLPTFADTGPEELGPLLAQLVEPFLPTYARLVHGEVTALEPAFEGGEAYLLTVDGTGEGVRILRQQVSGVGCFNIELEVGSKVVLLTLPDDQYLPIALADVKGLSLLGGTDQLINSTPILRELNRMNDRLEAIATALLTWVPVPLDGGAALKAAATAGLAPKPLANLSAPDLKNPKITH
jgi:hypothetical protein